MMDLFSKQQLEDKVAEVIDPECFNTREWDRDRQYDAIKKAGEILEIMLEELPSHFKEVVVRELEQEDDIHVIHEENLDELDTVAEHVDDPQYPDEEKVIDADDLNDLRTVAEYIKFYDFEDL